MILLLNLIFAVLAYLIANYLLTTTGVERTPTVVVSILIAVVVFIANLAQYVV